MFSIPILCCLERLIHHVSLVLLKSDMYVWRQVIQSAKSMGADSGFHSGRRGSSGENLTSSASSFPGSAPLIIFCCMVCMPSTIFSKSWEDSAHAPGPCWPTDPSSCPEPPLESHSPLQRRPLRLDQLLSLWNFNPFLFDETFLGSGPVHDWLSGPWPRPPFDDWLSGPWPRPPFDDWLSGPWPRPSSFDDLLSGP